MGFAGGSLTVRRFAVEGRTAKGLTPSALKRLQECAFGSYKTAAKDEMDTGWVCPTHLFDTEITEEKITVGKFVHLWMRMDQKRVPGAIVRSYIRQEEEAARGASGKVMLTKEQREQARAAAQERVDEEVKKGKFRRTSAVPVLWDTEGGWLYAAAVSENVRERLTALFTDTFDGRLLPVNCGTLAARLLGEKGNLRGFEDAVPFHLVELHGEEGADPLARNRLFVGREFLTWLWCRLDRGEGTFKFGSDTIQLTMFRSLVMECDYRVTGRMVMTATDPLAADEVRSALKRGKQPTRVGMMIGSRSGDWSFSFDGVQMTVSSLKLGEDGAEKKDLAARLETRFQQVRDLFRVLDGLYSAFLAERFGGQWNSSAERLRRWARGEGKVTATPRLITA